MEVDTGGNATTSKNPIKQEEIDDDLPPNITNEEENDDGYPNTPPVLERQDYYMENDDPEPEPSIAKKRTIPDKWYSFEDTEFYVPPDLRHLNPCKYAPHSRLLVNDLICILCQRVCNETYAVSCLCNHRFCKDCIMPRYNKHKYCPRCGAKLDEEPKPDDTYDFIIDLMSFDKSVVNYVNLEPELESAALADSSSSDDDDDYDDDIKSEDMKPAPRPNRWTMDHIVNFPKNVQRLAADVRRKYRLDTIKYDPGDDEAKRRRKRLNRMVIPPFEKPPYSYMQVHETMEESQEIKRNLIIEQTMGEGGERVVKEQAWMKLQAQEGYWKFTERWNKANLSKPLQNMVYKTFWFNKDVEWPENRAPTPPCGLTIAKLRDIKLANKARKYFWSDPFLSKREKKISIHHFLTTDLEEPYDIPQFPSSSDDDDPPPQFCPYKFDYPEKYRKPRKDWRKLFDAEGNPKKSLLKVKLSGMPTRHKRKLPKWRKEYGEPTMLIRESCSKSSVSFREMQRFYLGVPTNAKLGHIAKMVHKRLSIVKNLKLELVPKRFLVEFYLVTFSAPGNKINVIKCDKNQLSPAKPETSFSRNARSPPMPIMLQSELLGKKGSFPAKRSFAPPNTYVTSSSANREPTVREIALQKMEQEKKKLRQERMKRHPYNKRGYPVSPEYQYRPRKLLAYNIGDPSEVPTCTAPGTSAASTPTTTTSTPPASKPATLVVPPSAKAAVTTVTSSTKATLSTVPRLSASTTKSGTSPTKAVVQQKSQSILGAPPVLQPIVMKSPNLPPRLRPLPPGIQLTAMKSPTGIAPKNNGAKSTPQLSIPKEASKPSTSSNTPTSSRLPPRPNPSLNTSEKNPELVSILNNPSKFMPERRFSNPLPAPTLIPSKSSGPPQLKMATPMLAPNGSGLVPVNSRLVTTSQGTVMYHPSPATMSRVGNAVNPMPGQMVTYQQGMRNPHMTGSQFSEIQLSNYGNNNADDVILVPMASPSGNDVTYLQLTADGLVPCQNLGNGIVGITPPKNTVVTSSGPTFVQPLSTTSGGTYFQSYQPIVSLEQPVQRSAPVPPPAEPPKPQQPRGIGKGSLLPKNMTAYVTEYPLRSLDLNTEVKELRKKNKLKKGQRLCLFYSIKDLKCEEVPELPPPITYPPLARDVKRAQKRRFSSIDSVLKKEEESVTNSF